MRSPQISESDRRAGWRCDGCGYVHRAEQTPDECPACDIGWMGSWTGVPNGSSCTGCNYPCVDCTEV